MRFSYPHIISPVRTAACALGAILLSACGGPQPAEPLDEALEKAGKNRTELESVLEHYRTADPDSQKLAAAEFLIANMAGQYTLTSPDTVPYRDALRRIAAIPRAERQSSVPTRTAAILDSVLKAYPPRKIKEWDVQRISARTLIANIDSTFSCWRQTPWHTRYTFEDFCEWVLPYRVGNEVPDEDWRALALDTPREGEDTVRRQDSILKLAVLLINHTGMGYGTDILRYPLPMTYSELKSIGEGACFELADVATREFRSRGIPSAVDIVPAWANRSSAHAWNAVVFPGGDSCKGVGYHRKGWLQMENRISKIYRRRYSPMRDDILARHRESEEIHPFFGELNMQDVTAQYIKVSDITLDGLQVPENRLAWLCTFNNFAWVPIAYAEAGEGGNTTFRDMGRGLLMGGNKPLDLVDGGKGIVYLPAVWQNRQCIPAGRPFILYEDGRQESLVPNPVRTQTITLERKYPLAPSFQYYIKKMKGGKFQGANRADFSDAVTLFEIAGEQPHPFTPFAVPQQLQGPYRYLRYLLPDDNYGHISELRFYSDTTLLSGQILGTAGTSPKTGPESLFDGNMLSYCEYPDSAGNWAGLDLGQQRTVTGVAYRARTDDNDIAPGDLYELWYWDNGWRSLGRKQAADYKISWDNVPTGTLYWIYDRTKGVEQRIFTYRDEQITWW